MAKNKAICIKCGEWKISHLDKCRQCNFEPETEVDIAKSRILDFPWDFQSPSSDEVITTGRSIQELEEISSQIKIGIPFDFSEHEVEGVREVYVAIRDTSKLRIWLDVFLWVLPVIILGIFLLYMMD